MPEHHEDPIEQRLRAALEHRAATVQPGPGDLAAVQAGVAAERRRRQRRTVALGTAAAIAVVAGVVAVANLGDDDGEPVFTDDPTTTSTTAAPATTTTTEAPTTTTTEVLVDDDGVAGWPGFVARVFDNPESAALAFATDVLGFADPALEEGTTEGDEAEYVIHPRPTATVSTRVHLHHTGTDRGWVVTGATSSQGSIDDVHVADDGSITVTGAATAFEATVTVALLDLEGNVLAETTTTAGANGELGPYTATVGPAPSGSPHYVLVGEGDASGEGRFTWAAVADASDDD